MDHPAQGLLTSWIVRRWTSALRESVDGAPHIMDLPSRQFEDPPHVMSKRSRSIFKNFNTLN